MFENLLRICMDEGFPRSSSSREEDDLHVAETAPHVITEDAVVSLSPEFAVLSERFGELTDGKVIEINLQDLLEILPRKRKRKDSYRKLVNQLKEEKGVLLHITSRKKNHEMQIKW